MIKLKLVREIFLKDRILGTLTIGDYICFTGERIWLDNKPNVSCIPEGTYKVTKRYSPKYKNHLELHNVPKRSMILIHTMNWPNKESKGCIGVGTELRDIDSDGILELYQSRVALNKILNIIGDEPDIEIEISDINGVLNGK